MVDGSLLGTAIWYNHQPIVAAGQGVTWGGTPGDRGSRSPTMCAYKTRDGRFVSLVFVNDPDADWTDLCEHLERPELATDPRFSSTAARSANSAAAVQILDDIFAQRTLDEWKLALAAIRGVWAPVQTPSDILVDPQAIANGFIRSVEYPKGPITLPVPPVLFDEEAGDIAPAPDFCEHTEEVLLEAGLTAEEIARYRALGVIA